MEPGFQKRMKAAAFDLWRTTHPGGTLEEFEQSQAESRIKDRRYRQWEQERRVGDKADVFVRFLISLLRDVILPSILAWAIELIQPTVTYWKAWLACYITIQALRILRRIL